MEVIRFGYDTAELLQRKLEAFFAGQTFLVEHFEDKQEPRPKRTLIERFENAPLEVELRLHPRRDPSDSKAPIELIIQIKGIGRGHFWEEDSESRWTSFIFDDAFAEKRTLTVNHHSNRRGDFKTVYTRTTPG